MVKQPFPAERLQGWLPFVEASPVVGGLVQLVADLVEGGSVGWFVVLEIIQNACDLNFEMPSGIFLKGLNNPSSTSKLMRVSTLVGKHLPFSA